jgi:hypothetical protein
VIEAPKLVLAFGISDELPSVPGLAERWGSSVLHCPYCHGYEFSGRRLGVLNVSPMSVSPSAHPVGIARNPHDDGEVGPASRLDELTVLVTALYPGDPEAVGGMRG